MKIFKNKAGKRTDDRLQKLAGLSRSVLGQGAKGKGYIRNTSIC